MNILLLISSLVIAAIGAYFFYGIFAMQIGNMIRIKRETGLTYKSQISISWCKLTKKVKH